MSYDLWSAAAATPLWMRDWRDMALKVLACLQAGKVMFGERVRRVAMLCIARCYRGDPKRRRCRRTP